ncbi:hypothetical protein BCR33DRAFT_646919, partial [Rhizoclosmatium globosum]
TPIPAKFLLEESSRCKTCKTHFNPNKEVKTIKCVLMRAFHAEEKELEVQVCQECLKSRLNRHYLPYIGPDLSEFGVFNWSNKILFEHRLLDHYTLFVAKLPATFSGFAAIVSQYYIDSGSVEPFPCATTFIAAWFSFRKLQDITTGQCPSCGLSPEIAVFDGTSLAY